MLLTKKNQHKLLSRQFSINISGEGVQGPERIEDDDENTIIGVVHTLKQCDKLLEAGKSARHLMYFRM